MSDSKVKGTQTETTPDINSGSGVDDVRRVRDRIAREHGGDVAAHVAETNRVAEALRTKVPLGRTVPPPPRADQGVTGS